VGRIREASEAAPAGRWRLLSPRTCPVPKLAHSARAGRGDLARGTVELGWCSTPRKAHLGEPPEPLFCRSPCRGSRRDIMQRGRHRLHQLSEPSPMCATPALRVDEVHGRRVGALEGGGGAGRVAFRGRG